MARPGLDPHFAMETVVALSALSIFISAWVIAAALGRGAARSAKGKGRIGAVALAFGLAFSTVLDPPRKAAIEDARKNRVGRRETASGSD